MRIGLVLLPDESTSRALVTLARSLVPEGVAPRVVLGPERLAHVTLLHVEAEGGDEGVASAAAIWADAAAALAPTLPLSFTELRTIRYDVPYNAPPAPPASMAWCMVHASPALIAAERAAALLPSVRARHITTANGASFVPHVTLAIWDGAPDARVLAPSLPEALMHAVCTGRLAVGVIGANGVYTRTLFD